jgi:hypothetical protein
MFSTGVPKGTNPTIFAGVMTVVCFRRKSSTVSVSIFQGLAGRDSARVRFHGQVPFATDPYA